MKLKDLEEYLEEIEVQSYDLFEEQEQEYRLWLDNIAIHVTQHKIKIREGICETWDVDSQNYEVDHNFYMIFDEDIDEYLYLETGSSMCVSLHNFFSFNKKCNLSHDELLDLSCELQII